MTGTAYGAAPVVAFESVDVAYRDRTVLRDVTFDIEPGERVALVGPNGAGKSSLLRALAGLAPLRHGQIREDDSEAALLYELQGFICAPRHGDLMAHLGKDGGKHITDIFLVINHQHFGTAPC